MGGIFYLAFVVPALMKSERLRQVKRTSTRMAPSDGPFCPASHVAAIGRFSALAMLSVGVLLITGLYNAWAEVNSFAALKTPYGTTLLVKLALIVPWLILGAVNMLWIKRRLAGAGRSLRLLRKLTTAEGVLAILVLLCVGALISLEPARLAEVRQELRQPNRLTLQSSAEGTDARVVIEPASLGQNFITVYLTDKSGKAVTDASQVTLRLTYLDQQFAPSAENIIDHGNGIWIAHQAVFGVAGRWQADLTVKRRGAFDSRMSLVFKMPFSLASSLANGPPAQTGKRLWGAELLLLGFTFGGVSLYAGGRRTHLSIAGLLCGGIGIIGGAIVLLMAMGG